MGKKRAIFEMARRIVIKENFIITTKQFEHFKKHETMKTPDEVLAEQNAFHLVKALDLIDECYHYLKANPPGKTKMTYNKWQSLVEETNYMREFNAAAEHERINNESEYSPDQQVESLSERLRQESNRAIDDCIERLSSYRDIDRTQMKEELESLKTAHGEH